MARASSPSANTEVGMRLARPAAVSCIHPSLAGSGARRSSAGSWGVVSCSPPVGAFCGAAIIHSRNEACDLRFVMGPECEAIRRLAL